MSLFLEERLQKRDELGLTRKLTTCKNLVDLASNDYFGFAKATDLFQFDQVPSIGATGSRLLTGNHKYYEQLESKIADFHHAEACLIYNSGYTANLGLLSSLGTEEVTFLYDLDVHASMIDGIKLSKATSKPFRHQDLDSLESRLKTASPPVFILVESVYSMSGDLAPLQEIVELAEKYHAEVIVDEAHGLGFFGKYGEGLVSELALENRIFAKVHTFSKVLGVHGACVLGSQKLKSYQINFSRPLIYTTALPYPLLCLIESAYDKLQQEAKFHQDLLKELIGYFCEKFSSNHSVTPIQPIYIGDVETTREYASKLQASGLDVRPIVSPTVKRGKECLRVVLHSFNQKEEIDALHEVLK